MAQRFDSLADTATASGLGTMRVNPSMFRDFQAQVHSLGLEVDQIRKTISMTDETLRQEIDELSKDIEDECFERNDSFDRLRLEFQVFAHRKTEKVIQELEEFTKDQLVKDTQRERQILDIAREMDRVKMNLCGVGLAWGKVVSSVAGCRGGIATEVNLQIPSRADIENQNRFGGQHPGSSAPQAGYSPRR
eukprot:TRINITY_DN8847_c0_g1_i1.p1 TRINITY_DN8847_c0_g1~~TRINITY_DN8847_c0_g1_i1.p1  ORF type:complete len:191 (-),score=36.31 TRINITY_DN8847_c0_g1_i1:325-897(-)